MKPTPAEVYKLSMEIGSLSFKPAGERRPVSLDAVLQAGLKALRPNLGPDAYRELRQQIVIRLLESANQLRPPEQRFDLEKLRHRVAELEATQSNLPMFTEGELHYIRTLHIYGMTVRQIAELYAVPIESIKAVLAKRQIPAVYMDRMRSRMSKPQPGRRMFALAG